MLSCFAMNGVIVANAVESYEDTRGTYNILCLLSYNYSYNTVSDEINGIEAGLKAENENIDFSITYESMDGKHYYRSEDIGRFSEYLSYKISKHPPYDLIITADDTALRFVLNKRDELFAGIPVVFMGVNSVYDAYMAASIDGVTGVAEVPDYESNYQLMRKLFPDRNNITVIVDGTTTGQGEFVQFKEFIENHPNQKYEILNTSRYSRNGVKQYLSQLSETDIILYLDFLEDGDGNVYGLNNASKFICQYAADVPVFRVSSADVGNGILGGVSYSFFEAGKMAGKMGARIINGENPDDISIVTDTVTETYFEQEAMDKYGIKLNDIPEDAIILNEKFTVTAWYRANRVIANLVSLIGILLLIIIALLTMSNRKREKLVNEDTLTKIANRLYITKQIKSFTNSKERYGVIMVDLDYFKSINDGQGHLVGDEVLCALAKRLDVIANEEDSIAARIGGDEFLVLVKFATYGKCEKICKRIQESVSEPITTTKGEVNITVSMGAAVYPDDIDNPMKLMSKADKALYYIKENGRNGYKLYKDI